MKASQLTVAAPSTRRLAEHGHKEAKKARDLIAKEMTPEQIAEVKKLAEEWLEKHQTQK